LLIPQFHDVGDTALLWISFLLLRENFQWTHFCSFLEPAVRGTPEATLFC